MKKITILLAEDHTIVREGFRQMLELESDFEVIGEAPDGRQTVVLTKKLRPNVVLMDIAMPQLNGLEATRQLLKAVPETKIIILSAHGDDTYVQTAIAAGAAGFVLKQSSSHAVCEAIRTVGRGKTFFSPGIARHLDRQKKQTRNGDVKSSAVKLTSREMEVLQLIAEGKANKETAAALGIGIKTVEKHREHLMEKLDLHDTASITRYAISTGVIENSVQLTIVQ